MSDNRNVPLRQQLLDEIWEEISSLKGNELDEYLADVGLSSDSLLQDYEKALAATRVEFTSARFEEARKQVRHKSQPNLAVLLSFDLAKKRAILAAIGRYAARTNEMTIAARNQKIEDEDDLDSFLEACMKLGLIDSDGNLLT